MPKKKSLADELADLFNPAPAKEFDPEADVFGAGPALEESDDELVAQTAGRRKGKEAGRLRGDIVMEGREYAGRRTSRAALFGGEASEEEEEGEGDEGEGAHGKESGSGEEEEEDQEEEGRPQANGKLGVDGSSGSGSEEEDEGQDEDAGWLGDGTAGSSGSDEDEPPEAAAAGRGGAGRSRAARVAAAAEASSSDNDEGSDEEEEEGGWRRGGAAALVAAADDAEMAALEQEYEAMQQDEQAALARLKERAAKERRKALAVQAQQSVWQRGLEARILLQRALAGANRLPQGEMVSVAAATSPDVAAAFAGLAADATALAGELLQLLGALKEQNPAVGEAAAAAGVTGAGSKRGRGEEQEQRQEQSEAVWEKMEASYAAFSPFRDAAIDRWHRKTVLTAGGATLRGGQLRALNQSVSTQVAQLMQDSGKVVQRTRLPRSAQASDQHRVLCPDPEAPAPKRRRADAGGSEDEDAGAPETPHPDDERDPETFDDTEFYQTLLREFLEGSTDASGANWHTGPKQRKAVDRRASKGRKLRYHVHEKLVNFMAPVELAAPQYAAQLFSNLFGGGPAAGGAARK